MPRVAHVKTSLGRDLTGVNLTDATFQALTTGSGNGAEFTYSPTDIIILKNTTGGAAVFTFVVRVADEYTTFSVTVTNPTKSIATLKTYVFRPADIFKNATSLKMTIECDVAGSLLVLDCAN